jgi:hypothetical protein
MIAAAVYAAITIAILIASVKATDGHFIYPLDDVYINMAMAKNVALHGVWGISPYQFTSSTSTPLFVLLLSAIYRAVGPSTYAPLLISWAFGLASIYVASQIVADYLSVVQQSAALVVMVLLAPMFVVGTLGMEHSLHLLLTVLFIQRFERDSDSYWVIGGITVLMVATRYEGMFMAAVGSLVLITQRRWARAATLSAAALVPVCAYALFSISHHGFWLPNSIALKGTHVHGLTAAGRIFSILNTARSSCVRAPHLFFLMAAVAIAAISLWRRNPHLAAILMLVAGAGCLHIAAADVGWAWRYEDYLIASGIIVIACAFPLLRRSSRKTAAATTFLSFCAAAFLLGRAMQAAASLPPYSRAIYQQQWQMATFLREYYPDASIAANDIGAINFNGNFHCIDLVGLADSDIFAAKRSGHYSTQFLDGETARRGVEVAAIYDSWFSAHPKEFFEGPSIPGSWIRVGRWTVLQQMDLGDKTVSVYARTPNSAQLLRSHLDAFEKRLPRGVTAFH